MPNTACLRPCPYDHQTCSALGVALITLGCLAVAALGGLVTVTSVESWYPSLSKPVWTPPEWVFGPVWTVLYALMAVAGSMVWLSRDDHDVCGPMGLFVVQLAANLAWSVLFFGLQSPWLGFLDILLLWAAVGLMVVSFYRISPIAGMLMVPYWLWVSFAAALNGSIVVMSS